MPSDLEILIDFYQWEIVRIKKSIEENLELHHYKEVEFDERALGHAQTELDRLLELKNPIYRNIKNVEGMIQMYERIKKEKSAGKEGVFWNQYCDEKIRESKAELKGLENSKLERHSKESQFIDEAIYSMLKGKKSGFKLNLDESGIYVLSVRLVQELVFELEFFAEEEYSWLKRYSLLGELDFEPSNERLSLSRTFSLKDSRNVLPLKELISKVIIGLKYPLRIKNEIYFQWY